MQVLNLCLTFAFVIFGYVSLTHSVELVSTGLGRTMLLLIALFWFLRAVEQVIFFRLRHWASWAFLATFLGGTALYGVPLVISP